MSRIEELLAKAKESEPEPITVSVKVAGEDVEIRLRKVTGPEWNDIVLPHPPRPESAFDILAGFNPNGVPLSACPRCAVIVEDADEVTLEPEQWQALLNGLSGNDYYKISDALYRLHVGDVAEVMTALKKAFEPGVKPKRSSRGSSGSRSAGSTGGSPAKSKKSSMTKRGESFGL